MTVISAVSVAVTMRLVCGLPLMAAGALSGGSRFARHPLCAAPCTAITLFFGKWRQFATDALPTSGQQEVQTAPRTTRVTSLFDPDIAKDETRPQDNRHERSP
ncbi:MAG: hypothetical protein AB7E60_02340 [Sphingobium sp.]